MEKFPQRRLYSISEEITPVDDQLLRNGGISSNIARLPSRIQQAKQSSPASSKKIEDLVYEVGYLKAELQWHQESKQALLALQDQMRKMFSMMEDALVQVNIGLEQAEQRYLKLWGLEHDDRGSTIGMI
ncbi:hypothetical protein BDV26DRAFT_276122 [Aspergillus bertholletiae]|uniref:Uncharacterized protein n=1 Tax=Aspergillus bertholletiae TaxID=1226010 RepID=A0A5N7ANH0_9EURO|nr:hypothetical protein BDV26DRAFT_276122 [Aspergillus bertholletiae]